MLAEMRVQLSWVKFANLTAQFSKIAPQKLHFGVNT